MKAKEYAERYLTDPTEDNLVMVVRDMICEVKVIAKQRNTKSDAGVVPIFDELSKKWKAFVRIVGDETINEDGFKDAVKFYMPDVYNLWVCFKERSRLVNMRRKH